MVTDSYYYHRYAGLSSVLRTLPAASLDNIQDFHHLYLTLLPQSLYANLALAPVYTFYFRSFVPTLRCGPTVGILQSFSAPPSRIPQERVCSTTTFHDPHFKIHRVGGSYEITEQEFFVRLICQENVQAVSKSFPY